MTSSSPPQPRLLDDPNLRRLFRMVLGHRKVLAFALLATAVASATDPILAKLIGVLTDREFFGGSPDDLRVARAATGLPVLRKDFTVAPADVCDARIMGADAVLLIAAALDDDELGELHTLAVDVGLDVLVEVHDEEELDRAVTIEASLIGVNQRDLVTFEVDTERAVVAESGNQASGRRSASFDIEREEDAVGAGLELTAREQPARGAVLEPPDVGDAHPLEHARADDASRAPRAVDRRGGVTRR